MVLNMSLYTNSLAYRGIYGSAQEKKTRSNVSLPKGRALPNPCQSLLSIHLTASGRSTLLNAFSRKTSVKSMAVISASGIILWIAEISKPDPEQRFSILRDSVFFEESSFIIRMRAVSNSVLPRKRSHISSDFSSNLKRGAPPLRNFSE